jgi:UDP:flavonoid glycosyltransferase YjiC (YdhE family)
LAVLSLLPDMGHVIPVLRVANAAREGGFNVRCFLPTEAVPAAATRGFPVWDLGPTRPPGWEGLFSLLSRRGNVDGRIRSEQELLDRYLYPTKGASAEFLKNLTLEMARFKPDLVLTDHHFFRSQYEAISRVVGAPLILHRDEGTLRFAQRPFTKWFGISDLPNPVMSSAEWVLGRLRSLYWTYWEVTRRRLRKASIESERLATQALAEFSTSEMGTQDPVVITTGTGPLELRHLESVLRPPGSVLCLGPALTTSSAEVDPGLEVWLNSDSRPVVLASLGTLIPPRSASVEAITEGILAAECRVLWILKGGVPESISSGDPKEIRVEGSLPQQAILEDPMVAVFVSHMGAGGTQEALWSGTPVVAVPFQFDQHYNASLLVRLGVGTKLNHRKLSARKVQKAVGHARSKAMSQRAFSLAKEFREFESSQQLVELLKALLKPASAV